MGRPKKDRSLPPGLRVRNGYYSYWDPSEKVEYGLGRDRRSALTQAIEANLRRHTAPTLLERIAGTDKTWGQWCDDFEKILLKRTRLSDNTKRGNRSKMNRLRASFEPNRSAKGITVKDVAGVLAALKDESKDRMAQSFRSFLIDCFDRMVAAGIRQDNPVRVTDKIDAEVRRARLTFDVFMKIYQKPDLPVWLRNAMALALVSGQDRMTCALAEIQDFHDGFWWSERCKTEARIKIPLRIRLDIFGMSLEDVVRECRRTGILSKHLVHQTERGKGARLGRKMHKDVITREFTKEVLALGIDWGDRTHPTFHEIRSLATRLYDEQKNGVNTRAMLGESGDPDRDAKREWVEVTIDGGVDTQELLGHTEEDMTKTYRKGRGEWVEANMGAPSKTPRRRR